MGIRREEEMEMSDDDSEENPSKRFRSDDLGKMLQSVSSHACFYSVL